MDCPSDQLAALIEKADNYLAATLIPMPPVLHVEGLKVGMREMRDELKQIYLDNGGEDVWGDRAP